ncbi:hypothetical protein ACHAQH_006165 [Verticillium albo-atrum]
MSKTHEQPRRSGRIRKGTNGETQGAGHASDAGDPWTADDGKKDMTRGDAVYPGDFYNDSANKKSKSIKELGDEAYLRAKGTVSGNDLLLAMGAHLIERNNENAAWTGLAAQEMQIAGILDNRTQGDFTSIRRKAFNAVMDERIKQAKRTFRKLRSARRAEYDRRAVDEAQHQLELVRHVRALGPDWKPDPKLGWEGETDDDTDDE